MVEDTNSEAPSEAGHEETDEQTNHRRLIELLNELRVALPGVQVLFAFLLVVPFQQGFNTVTQLQRDIYYAALLCTTISTVFLIAPSAYHRIVFRQGEKERLLRTANAFTIVGLAFMALAIVGVVVLITSYLFGTRTAVLVGGAVGLLFASLWYGLPLLRRWRS